MKLYRARYWTATECSEGFTWHASRRDAERLASRWRRANARRYDLNGTPYDPGAETEVDVFEFTPTRVGILGLLNLIATHPDNG